MFEVNVDMDVKIRFFKAYVTSNVTNIDKYVKSFPLTCVERILYFIIIKTILNAIQCNSLNKSYFYGIILKIKWADMVSNNKVLDKISTGKEIRKAIVKKEQLDWSDIVWNIQKWSHLCRMAW